MEDQEFYFLVAQYIKFLNDPIVDIVLVATFELVTGIGHLPIDRKI